MPRNDKFPVTSRTDVLPAENPGFKAKYGQTHYDEAMNEPNDPRPAEDDVMKTKKDGQGFHDREDCSYNVTTQYWGAERKNPFSKDDSD